MNIARVAAVWPAGEGVEGGGVMFVTADYKLALGFEVISYKIICFSHIEFY